MISVMGFTCCPAEKRADLNRPHVTQSPASRPLTHRPAPVVKPPNPVRDSAQTGNPGDLQALSEALQRFHCCLVGRSSPWERFMQALKMLDVLREMSALRLPGLAELWEQARAMHRAALVEIAGPESEQIATILVPAFVSPFVSPASSLPAIPASPAPVLQPSAPSAPAPSAPTSPAPVLQAPASPAPVLQPPALRPPASPAPALQPPAPQPPAPSAPASSAPASSAPASLVPTLQATGTSARGPSAPAPSSPARASAVLGPSSHPVLGMSVIHSLRGGTMGHVFARGGPGGLASLMGHVFARGGPGGLASLLILVFASGSPGGLASAFTSPRCCSGGDPVKETGPTSPEVWPATGPAPSLLLVWSAAKQTQVPGPSFRAPPSHPRFGMSGIHPSRGGLCHDL